MKVAFMGRGETGLAILKALLEEDYKLTFVWTCKHTPEVGASPKDFEEVAEDNDLPFKFVKNINRSEYIETIIKYDPDIAVAIFWMNRVCAEILDLFDNGVLNLHGGDLPRYRGNAAANWAILENESELGITVHEMIPEIDAGPILAQEKVPITEDTKIFDLVKATREVGSRLILQVLDGYRRNTPTPKIEQNQDNALRCYPRRPSDGRVDWTQSAIQIDRHVRSLGYPYPNAFTYYGNKRIELIDVAVRKHPHDILAVPGHVIKSRDEVWVATGDGVVALDTIRPEDTSKSIPATDYFDSTRVRLGRNLYAEIALLNNRIAVLESELKDEGE